MADADQPTTCPECGTSAGLRIERLKPRRRVRFFGYAVGILVVTGWCVWAWSGRSNSRLTSGGALYTFLDPAISEAEVAEVGRHAPTVSDRLVAPLRSLAETYRRDAPFLDSALELRLCACEGEWYRMVEFGKPFPWMLRQESGTLGETGIPDGGLLPPARSLREWHPSFRLRMDRSAMYADGLGSVAPGQVNVMGGALAAVLGVAMAGGWLAAGIARRRRTSMTGWRLSGIWSLGCLSVLGIFLAWSLIAGEHTTSFAISSVAPVNGGRGAVGASAPLSSVVLLSPGDLADPLLTDAALAEKLLQTGGGEASEARRFLVVAPIPSHRLFNAPQRSYGRRFLTVVRVGTCSYAPVDDLTLPVAFPKSRGMARLMGEHLVVHGPTDGTGVERATVTLNLSLISIGLLSAMVAGGVGGSVARSLARACAGRRRRAHRCIQCAYPLPAPRH